MYSKDEAVKLLRGDKRVKKVITNSKTMYIYTHPITPIITKEEYKGSFLCSIGTYKIAITNHSHYITCKIRREKWKEDVHHYHIEERWGTYGSGEICWGTVKSEVSTIKDNKDWFWLAKRCLDLLEDGNPEYGETRKWYHNMYDLMIDYAKSKRNKKLAEKLEKIQKRKLKTCGR